MGKLHEAIELFEHVMISANEKITHELDEQAFKGLSIEQYEVLAFLKVKGDKTPGEIALFQNIKKSAMSNRLNKLLAQGYITYMPVPTGDKRSKHVHITDAGLAITDAIQQHYRGIIADLFEDMQEDEDLETFIRLLKLIQSRLKK